MTIESLPAQWRKKPIVVEAIQFNGSNAGACGLVKQERPGIYNSYYVYGVETPTGFMAARRGDWIITGVQGERYPCKSDIFDATYEPVLDARPRDEELLALADRMDEAATLAQNHGGSASWKVVRRFAHELRTLASRRVTVDEAMIERAEAYMVRVLPGKSTGVLGGSFNFYELLTAALTTVTDHRPFPAPGACVHNWNDSGQHAGTNLVRCSRCQMVSAAGSEGVPYGLPAAPAQGQVPEGDEQ